MGSRAAHISDFILADSYRNVYCNYGKIDCKSRKNMLDYAQEKNRKGMIFVKIGDLSKLAQALPANASSEQTAQFLKERGFDAGNVYQEMEMTDAYVDTHQDVSYANSVVNLHSHSFYEILYICNDCAVEYLVGAERYRLQKGDIVIVAPGVSHRPILPERMQVPYRRYVIWLSTEFAQQMHGVFPQEIENIPKGASLLRTAGTRWEFLGDYFARGVEESERKAPFWRSAVYGNTIYLAGQLYRAIVSGDYAGLKAEKPELLDDVMAYIEANLSRKITLADIAREFYVSSSTISQLFRKKMGVSFYRCVTQRRLIAAKSLILDGVPLEAVNEQVGFTDYSTFYRAFKQEYGVSPRQFRTGFGEKSV